MRPSCRLLSLGFLALSAVASAAPVIHGYGNRGCPEYLDTYSAWEAGDERGVLAYLGYEQWLAGLVSGLSLATGEDILRGADVEGLMRRIKLRCEDDREQDVLAAARAHIADLSPLR